MLRRGNRFHGYNSLNFVYRTGRTVRTSDLSLRYTLSNKRQTYRAAVVVAKKIHKSAVVRNRIRRRIFEQVRLNSQRITKPYDLVFTVNTERIATMPHGELAQNIEQLLEQAGVITTPNQ